MQCTSLYQGSTREKKKKKNARCTRELYDQEVRCEGFHDRDNQSGTRSKCGEMTMALVSELKYKKEKLGKVTRAVLKK